MAEPILYISPSDGGKGINMTSGTRLLKFLGYYDTNGTGNPPSAVLNGYTGGGIISRAVRFWRGDTTSGLLCGVGVVGYWVFNVWKSHNIHYIREQ